jgi:hypothetical protein
MSPLNDGVHCNDSPHLLRNMSVTARRKNGTDRRIYRSIGLAYRLLFLDFLSFGD